MSNMFDTRLQQRSVGRSVKYELQDLTTLVLVVKISTTQSISSTWHMINKPSEFYHHHHHFICSKTKDAAMQTNLSTVS